MALDELSFDPETPVALRLREVPNRKDDEGALLLIRHVSDHPEISIAGDLGTRSSARLREAVEMSVEGCPSSLTIDGRGIGRVGVAGLNAIADAVALCRDRSIQLDLCLSSSARAVLDSVGLWWLGVIDRRPVLEAAIRDARLAYGRRPDIG